LNLKYERPAEAGKKNTHKHMNKNQPTVHAHRYEGGGWNVTLACSVSQQTFSAGRLIDDSSWMMQTALGDPDDDHADNPTILYPRKAMAHQAAAARALDYWNYVEKGVLQPRLCMEDPRDVRLSSGSSNDEDDDDLVHVTEALVPSSPHGGDKKSSVAQQVLPRVDPFGSIEGPECSDDEEDDMSSSHDNRAHDDDEAPDIEPEWMVVPAPASTDFRTPAEQLLRALAEAAPPATTSMGFPIVSTQQRRLVEPAMGARRARDSAAEWVETERRRRRHVPTPGAISHRIVLGQHQDSDEELLLRAKSTLRALATAVQGLPLDRPSLNGTQAVAYSILELLWETILAKPDADTYALYLQCLDGHDAFEVASKAETVVQCMHRGKYTQGYMAPPPNVQTMNQLIKMWAETGSEKARYETLLPHFQPNAATFLALLTSEAYTTTKGLDTQFCTACVEKLRELESRDGAALDWRSILNAPLRWSGGTRADHRPTPWDDYGGEVFAKGFQVYDEGSIAVQNAKATQEWVENFSTMSVTPDIVSHEAVMQAWVRTGTRKGLEHAEAILEQLLSEDQDSPCFPRFQTFHPVLAAWLHSKDAETGVRLRHWTDKVFELAAESSAVFPDARLYELAIWARRSVLHQHKKETNPAIVLETVRECSELLRQFCAAAEESYTDEEGPIFTSIWRPFVHTMDAWGHAQLSVDSTLLELEKIKRDYEHLLSSFSAHERPDKNRASGLLSERLREIVTTSHRIYYKYVSMVERVVFPDNGGVSPPPSILVDVEGCMRKMGEINELERMYIEWKESQLYFVPEHKSFFADQFDYGFANKTLRRSNFPWRVTYLLWKFQSQDKESPNGDFVRLCQLLNQVGRAWKFRSTKFEKQVSSLLDAALPGSQHRDSLLESVRQVSTEKEDISDVLDDDPAIEPPFDPKQHARRSSSKRPVRRPSKRGSSGGSRRSAKR
jgi:hypothetical protein